MVEHQLRITPTEGGYWLVSNKRTWFCTTEVFNDFYSAIGMILHTDPTKEWRNFEEPVRERVVSKTPEPKSRPTLNDILDLL